MPGPPPAPVSRTGGDDAVCFTAGYKGASFGAGVIHAWLAADRRPPLIAAGISMGALSAAAMQRSYQELENSQADPSQREVRRWAWFRTYLKEISDRPLSVFWDAIPDPIDYFADKPPVVDRSCPAPLRAAEAESRQQYYRLVKLGRWMAGLPVSLRSVARAVVAYVRYKERYGAWGPVRWLQYRLHAGRLVFSVLRHVCLSPHLTLETTGRPAWFRWRLRPLFGWVTWSLAWLIATTAVYCLLRLWDRLQHWMPPWSAELLEEAPWIGDAFIRLRELNLDWLGWNGLEWPAALIGAAVVVLGLAAALDEAIRRGLLAVAIPHLLRQLQISRGPVHEYRLQSRLFELFRNPESPDATPVVGESPMQVLIVAAPLQELHLPAWLGFFSSEAWRLRRSRASWRLKEAPPRLDTPLSGHQVWAAPGTPLVQALQAALAIPGLFPPLRLTDPAAIRQWLSIAPNRQAPPRLDLVDGVVIRENPIPALFAFLKTRKGAALAAKLESKPDDPRLHVVHNVPIQPAAPKQGDAPERINIVRAAFASLDLARHQDTQMEVRQTNFISALQHEIRSIAPQAPQEALRTFVDEIAPEQEIVYENNLDPARAEVLTVAAGGCRRTLERLYRSRLESLPADSSGVPCHELLVSLAPNRRSSVSEEAPGLREVCRHCTRRLQRPEPRAAPPGVVKSYWLPAGRELSDEFDHLRGDKPRIVFVASGGVFRGAFHIGILSALCAAEIRPDLIVGASVGALMGGALGAISVLPDKQASRVLAELCTVFLEVDQRVALTRTIKNAAKQLGIRARHIRLSPAELRRVIRKGTRSDPGYAALGAPPALLDAISELFFLPHEITRGIASQFVAGHITDALKQFWEAVQKETLRRLEIEHALMGTSLLEPVARTLLGGGDASEGEKSFRLPLNVTQPYHRDDKKVSFFSTTSNLNDRTYLLLGRDFLHRAASYDFVQAALSSSAFPAVFSPRQEAEVIPGSGRTDVLFSDGGMFDNLPFFPAMEVLGDVQSDYRRRTGMSQRDFLEIRSRQPDLFVAGALDAAPTPQDDDSFDNVWSIQSHAATLKKNAKLDSFEVAAELVGRQIRRLVEISHPDSSFQNPAFLDHIVNAAVLKIVPHDADHINPTFAFCASTGLRTGRIRLSVADGCFQTLKRIAAAQANADETSRTLAEKSVRVLTGMKIPKIRRLWPPAKADRGECPFFQVEERPLTCPFVKAGSCVGYEGVRHIYQTCRDDPAHRKVTAGSASSSQQSPGPGERVPRAGRGLGAAAG